MYSVSLLSWYKSTNTDAAQDRCDSTITSLDHTRIGWAYFGGGIACGLLLAALIAGVVYILENMKKKKGDEEAGELRRVTGGELGTLRMAHTVRAPVWARLNPDTQFSPPSRSTGSVASLDVGKLGRVTGGELDTLRMTSAARAPSRSTGSVGSVDVRNSHTEVGSLGGEDGLACCVVKKEGVRGVLPSPPVFF